MPQEGMPINNKPEDFDAEGNPRSAHEMGGGGFFYGSDKEYANEQRSRHEEAK